MSKTANKKAIKALPALRTSLLWFKRETVRSLRRQAEHVASPRLRTALYERASRVRKLDLADLRDAYQAERVSEILAARMFELARRVPGFVRL